MSNWPAIIFGLIVLLLVFGAALLPIRRGMAIHCYGGIDTRMQVRGLPFGYSSQTAEPAASCYEAAATIYSAKPISDSFQTASVWYDLITYGVILAAALVLMDKIKVMA